MPPPCQSGNSPNNQTGDCRRASHAITKDLCALVGLIEPNAVSVASALGVLGMLLLTISLLVASKTLGKRLGQLFRAG